MKSRTYTGPLADRFATITTEGRVAIDFRALDRLVGEATDRTITAELRAIAQDYRSAASVRGCRAESERHRVAAHLAEELDELAAQHSARAKRHRDHGDDPSLSLPDCVQDRPILDTVAERLRLASMAGHHVPVRFMDIAEWFAIAAEVHAGTVPCDWCAAGACPAIDAASALLGDPPARFVTRLNTTTGK